MRIVAIADDDSLVGRMSSVNAELVISLGDILDITISKVQQLYGCSKVFAVRGNHDTAGPFPEVAADLHLAMVSYGGLSFGGFGGSWKYKPRGHHLFEQQEVIDALRTFPYVDVFLAHNSPRGLHERDSDVHQGFDAFRQYIDRVRPRYFIHGHQHVNRVTLMDKTTVIGVFGEVLLNLEVYRRDGVPTKDSGCLGSSAASRYNAYACYE